METKLRAAVIMMLAKYDAHLEDDNVIATVKGRTSIRVADRKGRLRFENASTGDLYMSGPRTAESVKHFVEGFWYWEPKDANRLT